MRVSREQMEKNKVAILEAAGGLFREHGFEAVTVADVMKAAGLTHGAFYGYFDSKEDLITQTLADAIAAGPSAADIDIQTFANHYLTTRHRDDLAGGCLFAALASEAIRQPENARDEMTLGLKRELEQLSRDAPGADLATKRRAAIGSRAAMLGALILSRLSSDEKLSREILGATKTWLGEQWQGADK